MKEYQFWILVGVLCFILEATTKDYYVANASLACGIISFIVASILIFTKDKNI